MSLLPETQMIVLLDVQKVEIHGSVYFQVTYRTEASGSVTGNPTLQAIRINPEAFYNNPRAGDRVKVTLLMGNIMGAEKQD